MKNTLGLVFDMIMLLIEDFKHKKGSDHENLKEILEIILGLRDFKNIKTKHFDI